MIRSLHIEGWRAFADLQLELDEGVTFVVAENGVGKTSLVQAAAWGLYGHLSGVDAHSARRIGTDHTRVEVELELPDTRTLKIAREVTGRAETVGAWLGDTELDDDATALVLAEAYGASREFLSKTTVIPSDAVADDTTSAFQLREHLCRVFGVDELEAAAERLRRLHHDSGAAAKQVRQRTRRADADLAALRNDLALAEDASAAAEAAKETARAAVRASEEHMSRALAAQAARAMAADAWLDFTALRDEALAHLGAETGAATVDRPDRLTARLEAAEAVAAEALDELRREAATTVGRLAAIRTAAEELRTAGAECPVCRRELSPEDRAHADEANQRDTTVLSDRERDLSGLVEQASDRVTTLRTLSRRAGRLPDISKPSKQQAVDVEDASTELDHLRAEADRLVELAVEARTQRTTLAAQISIEESAAHEMREAYIAHRREAVTGIAAEVMAATANTILAERIDPLAAEVSHRWKRVFGERGQLRLGADGRLVVVRGVNEIPFDQFSSGEKVVALLATRLLVLSASTRASFLWLDEPLEHLDPKNRRLTASLMATAGGHVRQVLVTTYEEALARRLATATNAQLRYVRAAEIGA